MRKLAIAVLLVASACRSTTTAGAPAPTGAPGAATAPDAIARFMTAAKAQDLQALSLIWGSSSGPVMETMDRSEREMREITLLCYLKHDSYRVLAQSPSANNERMFSVELKFQDLTRSTSFYATLGPKERWYVRQVDIEPLRDICARR